MADQETAPGRSFEPAPDSGLLTFLQLLAFLQIKADPAQILHERGEGNAPFGIRDMLRSAKRLGVKARQVATKTDQLQHLPLPAIGQGRDGSFFLIARAAERKLAAYVQTGFKVMRLAVWGSGAVQLVAKITTVMILYIGAKQVIAGNLTVGGLVAFNMLAGRVSTPILRLAQLAQDVQQVKISINRLGDVLNAKPEPEHDPNRAALPSIEGRIQFERVRFRYGSELPDVLKGVDLHVAPGEMIGVVGPSGSGKSTFTSLIQRLHVPTQGRVLVDGVDLMLVDGAWLRRQVGVVLQENELLNRSVRDNIALADPIAPMDRVIEVAQLAGAHEFILQLPYGYDTQLEERGRNLSGGQRQRIAIARALMHDPKILILDEATSALDAESEEIVQNNLKDIARNRTVIIVAHRLSAVRSADRIVTIENGEITEVGTHQTLVKSGGRYADLYRRQMGVVA